MAPLSYKALLALAISMLASKTNAAPYVYTTSATTSSANWVTENLPLSDLMYFFFHTGTGDQDAVYYNPSGYDTYASSTSTSSTSSSSTTMTTSTATSTPSSSYSRVTLSDTSSSSASASTSSSSSTSAPSTSSTVVELTSSTPLSSTSSYTVPTYFPASSYSDQASVLSSILSDETPSIAPELSTALDSALNNPRVYFTTSADASTFTTESEGTQLTYTHLLGLEPDYVSVTAGAGENTTTIFESPVVHTITDEASTRTINEGTHTHTVYEKPVTRIVTDAPVVHTAYEKPVVKTVVHMVYRTEKPHIRYITRRIHRHHHDHHDHDHKTESADSVSRTTSTLAPSSATN